MSKNVAGKKRRREPTDLSGAHIPRTDLSYANLVKAKFSNANLTGTNFESADLRDANFSNAKLVEANLSHANLSHADLSNCDLSKANLKGANLNETMFDCANLIYAILKNTDLSTAKGLTWSELLKAHIDENTTVPDYLEEDNLFEILEILNPNYQWKSDFSGKLKDLFHEFSKMRDLDTNKTVHEILINARIEQENGADG